MMAVLDEEEFVASAIVYPASTEDVQKIVLWANKHLVPISPTSMGRNCGCPFSDACLRCHVTNTFFSRLWRSCSPRPWLSHT